MIWLLKFLVIWTSIDVLVIATGWYARSVIKAQFPIWWKRAICDDGPDSEPELDPFVQAVPTRPSGEFN